MNEIPAASSLDSAGGNEAYPAPSPDTGEGVNDGAGGVVHVPAFPPKDGNGAFNLPAVNGGFKCILADPPWNFRSYARCADPASGRHVERYYPTMSLSAIKEMPVKEIAAPDAHLFLWVTGPHLPSAFDVIRAWGFRYSGLGFTWIKLKRSIDTRQLRMITTAESDLHVGLGFTTRKNAEFCLLARRGNARRNAKNIREVILSPVREHSRKPDDQYHRIESYCDGPYLELFARSTRPGWTPWGRDVGQFDAAAA